MSWVVPQRIDRLHLQSHPLGEHVRHKESDDYAVAVLNILAGDVATGLY